MTPIARPPATGTLTFWVPCELKNYANHGGHWTGKAGYQRALRDTTHVLASALDPIGHWPANMPKCITITAHVWNYFDAHDGLRNACKPLVDGLVRARVIHSDAHDCGHQFLFTQVIDRTRRGVQITVEPR
jgi:hypothetical protein